MPNHLVFNNVANQLQTQIYGTDGNTIHAIKTDSCGRLEVVGTFTAVTAETVVELKKDLVNASGAGTALTVETIRLKSYTFYVKNIGTGTFKVKLQVSPQDSDPYFIDDVSGEFILGSGNETKVILVPRFFLKYTRLHYEVISGNATAEVWFNGRG